MRDVFDSKVSEYLLEQMVDEGYYEKTGDTDATTLRPPHTHEEFTITEIADEVETAIDRLGRELDSHTEARAVAADELSLRPDEVLDELRAGDELDRIKRYNRVVERLQDGDFDLAARPFEFTSDEVTYIPTDLAEEAYEKIELEERSREYDRQMQERREEARRAENTHRYEVVETAGEEGRLQVVTHDPTVMNSQHRTLYIPEAEVSSQERRQLETLEAGDEITLRIETHMRTRDDYIASIGGP
jgi:ribosomal protein L16 Arg81 hydroxylase